MAKSAKFPTRTACLSPDARCPAGESRPRTRRASGGGKLAVTREREEPAVTGPDVDCSVHDGRRRINSGDRHDDRVGERLEAAVRGNSGLELREGLTSPEETRQWTTKAAVTTAEPAKMATARSVLMLATSVGIPAGR